MLEKYLNISLIAPSLAAKDQEEVLHELSVLISGSHKGLSAEDVEKALIDRELMDSTGIQEGVAIPHAKLPNISKTLLAFGRSHAGINFHAHDKGLTHLFFVMLAPVNAVDEHIKLLSRIAKLLGDSGLIKELTEAKSAEKIYDILIAHDLKL